MVCGECRRLRGRCVDVKTRVAVPGCRPRRWPAPGRCRCRRRAGSASMRAGASAGAEVGGSGVDRACEAHGAGLGAEGEGRGRVVGQAGGAGVDGTIGAVVSTVQVKEAGVGRRCRRCRSPGPRSYGRRRRARHRPAARCRAQTLRRRGGIRRGDAGAAGVVPEKAKLAVATLLRPAGWESMLVVGAVVSTVQLKEAGVWSTLPACVDRPDLEGMGAVGECGIGLRRGAGGKRCAVAAAFEGGDAGAAGVGAREGEVGRGGVGQRRRARVDVGGRGGGVDRPAEGGRGLVDVAGGVDRPHFERMGAVGECGIGLRRGAGGKRCAVAAAFEGGDAGAAGVAAREGEAGRGGVGQRRRARVDAGVGAAVSTVQLKVAGVWSTLPAVSIARTSKVWEPSASAA